MPVEEFIEFVSNYNLNKSGDKRVSVLKENVNTKDSISIAKVKEIIDIKNKYKRNYTAFMKKNKRYRRVLEISGLCFFEYSIDTGRYILGDEFEDVLMYNAERLYKTIDKMRDDEISGKLYGDMFYLIHKEDRDLGRKALGELNKNLICNTQLRFLCGDGKYHPIRIRIHMLKHERCTIACISRKDDIVRRIETIQERGISKTAVRMRNYITAFDEIKEHMLNGPQTGDMLILVNAENKKYSKNSLESKIEDEDLIYFIEKIPRVFEENAISTRVGGTEFLIFVKNIEEITDVEAKINELKTLIYNCPSMKEKKSDFSLNIAKVYIDKKIYNDFLNSKSINENDMYKRRNVDVMIKDIYEMAYEKLYLSESENKKGENGE